MCRYQQTKLASQLFEEAVQELLRVPSPPSRTAVEEKAGDGGDSKKHVTAPAIIVTTSPPAKGSAATGEGGAADTATEKDQLPSSAPTLSARQSTVDSQASKASEKSMIEEGASADPDADASVLPAVTGSPTSEQRNSDGGGGATSFATTSRNDGPVIPPNPADSSAGTSPVPTAAADKSSVEGAVVAPTTADTSGELASQSQGGTEVTDGRDVVTTVTDSTVQSGLTSTTGNASTARVPLKEENPPAHVSSAAGASSSSPADRVSTSTETGALTPATTATGVSTTSSAPATAECVVDTSSGREPRLSPAATLAPQPRVTPTDTPSSPDTVDRPTPVSTAAASLAAVNDATKTPVPADPVAAATTASTQAVNPLASSATAAAAASVAPPAAGNTGEGKEPLRAKEEGPAAAAAAAVELIKAAVAAGGGGMSAKGAGGARSANRYAGDMVVYLTRFRRDIFLNATHWNDRCVSTDGVRTGGSLR